VRKKDNVLVALGGIYYYDDNKSDLTSFFLAILTSRLDFCRGNSPNGIIFTTQNFFIA
jgi:hypothetical protein